jgi:hypothetical protein
MEKWASGGRKGKSQERAPKPKSFIKKIIKKINN